MVRPVELRCVSQAGREGFVFVSSGTNEVKMYDVGEETDVITFKGHTEEVTCLDMCRNSWFTAQLVTVSHDGAWCCWLSPSVTGVKGQDRSCVGSQDRRGARPIPM